MTLEQDDLKGDFTFYGHSKLIFSKAKYFNFHVPLALSRLMSLKDGDKVQVHVNLNKKIIVLKLMKEEKKPHKK